MVEVAVEDQREKPETQEHPEESGASHDGERGRDPASGQGVRSGEDEDEEEGREPLLSQDRAQEEEHERERDGQEHGDRGPPEKVVDDGARAHKGGQPGCGRHGWRRLEHASHELLDLRRDRLESAEQRAGEQHTSDERVGQTPREQTRPRDQRVGPAAPDEWFERDVQHPPEAGGEERLAQAEEEQAELQSARDVARFDSPGEHEAPEHEGGQAHRPPPVAAAEPKISPGNQRAGDDKDEEYADAENLGGLASARRLGRGRPRRPAPGPGELEEDRPSAPGRRFDSQRAVRPFGLALDPRHAAVRERGRKPLWLELRKGRGVEPGFGKKN